MELSRGENRKSIFGLKTDPVSDMLLCMHGNVTYIPNGYVLGTILDILCTNASQVISHTLIIFTLKRLVYSG